MGGHRSSVEFSGAKWGSVGVSETQWRLSGDHWRSVVLGGGQWGSVGVSEDQWG